MVGWWVLWGWVTFRVPLVAERDARRGDKFSSVSTTDLGWVNVIKGMRFVSLLNSSKKIGAAIELLLQANRHSTGTINC